MAITNMTIAEGATYTPSGGVNFALTESGERIGDGKVYHNAAEANFLVREKVLVSSRVPRLGADGEWVKCKHSFRIVRPYTTSSGKVVQNLFRGEIEVHPGAGQTEIDNLVNLAVGFMVSSASAEFRRSGTLS